MYNFCSQEVVVYFIELFLRAIVLLAPGVRFSQLISCTYRINSEKADKEYTNETLEAVSGLVTT